MYNVYATSSVFLLSLQVKLRKIAEGSADNGRR